MKRRDRSLYRQRAFDFSNGDDAHGELLACLLAAIPAVDASKAQAFTLTLTRLCPGASTLDCRPAVIVFKPPEYAAVADAVAGGILDRSQHFRAHLVVEFRVEVDQSFPLAAKGFFDNVTEGPNIEPEHPVLQSAQYSQELDAEVLRKTKGTLEAFVEKNAANLTLFFPLQLGQHLGHILGGLALVLVVGGIIAGLLLGGWEGLKIGLGPESVKPVIPNAREFLIAVTVLVIPQIPLSLGNAIIGMSDMTCTLFGKGECAGKATSRSFATSMGIANIIVGFFAGMPMCHGAGGLAAHYRFGARTGGSNLMIGAIFVVLGVVFGRAALTLLTIIPLGVLGALLLYAGLELTGTIKDISEPRDLFVVFLIIGISLATTNMAIAFVVGILVEALLKKGKVRL